MKNFNLNQKLCVIVSIIKAKLLVYYKDNATNRNSKTVLLVQNWAFGNESTKAQTVQIHSSVPITRSGLSRQNDCLAGSVGSYDLHSNINAYHFPLQAYQ